MLFEHVGVAAPYVVGAAMVGVALLLVARLTVPAPAGGPGSPVSGRRGLWGRSAGMPRGAATTDA